jgi:hypothetical protein
MTTLDLILTSEIAQLKALSFGLSKILPVPEKVNGEDTDNPVREGSEREVNHE